MDLSIAVGIIIGLGLISIGIVTQQGGSLEFFWNPQGLVIVFGGLLAATLVNYPLKNIVGLFRVFRVIFSGQSYSYKDMIDELVRMAGKARKSGIMSLEADLDKIGDTYLRNGIELAINERDAVRLRNYLNLELENIKQRHTIGQEIFFYMGAYAPAFGLLGTVIGLVIMMNNYHVPTTAGSITYDIGQRFSELLGGMGLALVTTFYGVLLANMIFIPIGGKLKRKSEEELMQKQIMTEGVIGIHAKDHPLILREKLMTFVPQSKRKIHT